METEEKGVEKVVENDEDISCGCGPVCGAVLTRATDQYTPANPSNYPLHVTCPYNFLRFPFFPSFLTFRTKTRFNRRKDRIVPLAAGHFSSNSAGVCRNFVRSNSVKRERGVLS